jgi:hypothetical protein
MTSKQTTTVEGVGAAAASHAAPGGTPSQTISIGPAPTTTTTLSQSVSTSTTSPSTGQIEQGWLDGPTAVSAAYPRAATTGGVIRATWDTTATLTFSYSCPTGSDSITGTSGLVLTVPDGSCQIMIAGPTDVPQTEYSLDLGGS